MASLELVNYLTGDQLLPPGIRKRLHVIGTALHAKYPLNKFMPMPWHEKWQAMQDVMPEGYFGKPDEDEYCELMDALRHLCKQIVLPKGSQLSIKLTVCDTCFSNCCYWSGHSRLFRTVVVQESPRRNRRLPVPGEAKPITTP